MKVRAFCSWDFAQGQDILLRITTNILSWLYEEKRIVPELSLDFFFPFFSLFPIQDLYQYKIEVTCL